MKSITTYKAILSILLLAVCAIQTKAEQRGIPFVLVEYNCENAFDCRHDSLKNDKEFLPDSKLQWTFGRYWKKLNDIGRVIQQCGETDDKETYHLPDLVALCEVENDSVLLMLTRHSALKGAGYKYVMTDSPDLRGIDVALLYNPLTFRLIESRSLRISVSHGAHPTRDILYVKGKMRAADTLHIFVLHAPSRRGGAKASEPHRLLVADRILQSVDSIRFNQPDAAIIITGDFNDYSSDRSIQMFAENGFHEVSKDARGLNADISGATGTYRYKGFWESLDHIMLSPILANHVTHCYILDHKWMLEEDKTWGGFKPFRTYNGPFYIHGVSDHLPLVLRMSLP